MVILVDQQNLPEDIYKVIFATEQQEIVAKMLIRYMIINGGEIGKTEMGLFANNLHEGKVILKEKGKSKRIKGRLSEGNHWCPRVFSPVSSVAKNAALSNDNRQLAFVKEIRKDFRIVAGD